MKSSPCACSSKKAAIEDETVKKAREAEALTLNQYKAGTVPYSSVITAQTTRLSAEETALQVLSSRLQASVALIEALGRRLGRFPSHREIAAPDASLLSRRQLHLIEHRRDMTAQQRHLRLPLFLRTAILRGSEPRPPRAWPRAVRPCTTGDCRPARPVSDRASKFRSS